MRWWPLLLLMIACGAPVPLGVYRLPVQTGPEEVELRTFLLAGDARQLELYDGRDGRLFGRGDSGFSWGYEPKPYEFEVPAEFPLSLFLRDSLVEDAMPRPFPKMPVAPIEAGAESLRRAMLEAAGEGLELTIAGNQIFADRAAAEPDQDETPSLITVLNSVSGAGIVLPRAANAGREWRDAMSTAMPPDGSRPMPCAAPLVSVLRSSLEVVDTPAGEFHALKVVEAVDACRFADAEPQVFRVERWFAEGVGPVKILYVASDGLRREFLLVDHDVRSGSAEIWPLEQENRWTYEVRNARGDVVESAVELKVVEHREVRLP